MGCAVSSCSSVVDAFMKLSRVELGENPFHVVVCHYAPVVMTPSLYEVSLRKYTNTRRDKNVAFINERYSLLTKKFASCANK